MSMTVKQLCERLSAYPADYEIVIQNRCEDGTSYHEIDTVDEGFLPSSVVTLTVGEMISG
jgi:hypothetical protein